MKKKKIGKIVLSILLMLAAALIVNSIPAWNLKTDGMHEIDGDWIRVFYENEKDAANDVFHLADAKAKQLADKFDFQEKQNITIYIYDHQSVMQRKKYGMIGPLLGLDWYIGDNIGTNVLLTSPANPGKVHSYDDNKDAVLHEMVHAYVSILNPDVKLWLTEGTALYLSNGERFYKHDLKSRNIPSYKDIQTKNPITFSNMGGYTFAHTYIEYIDVTYGWDAVLDIIRTNDYEKVFGKTQKDIYMEWVSYLNNYYQ